MFTLDVITPPLPIPCVGAARKCEDVSIDPFLSYVLTGFGTVTDSNNTNVMTSSLANELHKLMIEVHIGM